MREVVLMMAMSLDGFVSGPEGEIDWIFDGDQEAIAWKVKNLWNASLHIMGSRTFRTMAAFWPTATGLFAPPMNQIPKTVFSRQGAAIPNTTAPPGDPEDAQGEAGSHPSARPRPGAESWGEAHVASGDLTDEIARLKAQGGKPIIAHGGATFARSLIAANLVDRYVLLVHPLALGKGLPLFSGITAPRRLKPIGSTTFPKGSVAQIYRPA